MQRIGYIMAIKQTPYLKLPYNEGADAGFREQYVKAMDKIDSIFPTPQSIKYPTKPRSIFDDNLFVPHKDFKIRENNPRYVVLGNMFFYEVGVESKKDIAVPSSGDITNILLGNFSTKFRRKRGFHMVGMNGVAASYGMGGETEVYVTSFGGMVAGNKVPKGTYFGFAGHYYLTD